MNSNNLWYTIEDNLFEEFKQEFNTAEEIILISPYISSSFVDYLHNILINSNRKIEVKILTTTFNDQNTVLDLKGLYNKIYSLNDDLINIEIKLQISKTNNIHMKNFIFKRPECFSTSIIGSSNLTEGGFKKNIELNVKLFEQNEINIFKKLNLYFKKLWNQKNLISFSEETKNKIFNISDNLKYNKNNLILTELENSYILKSHQLEALNKIEEEYNLGIMKHLIVMATGTGKTVLAAFATKERFENSIQKTRFLFVAHQKEIIYQAFNTYRSILDKKIKMAVIDNEFKGNITSIINDLNVNIFITVQRLNNLINKKLISKDLFTLIFYDEVHHYEAKTYKRVITFFEGEIFGLTATPQRMDGKNISNQFGDSTTYELSFVDAVETDLLSKFNYYVINDDTLNLGDIDLEKVSKIWVALKNSEPGARDKLFLSSLKKYIPDYNKEYIQGIIYCVNQSHAFETNNFLNDNNLKSNVLTSKNSSSERKKILKDFREKNINYICVVDLINEGIDIPTINLIIRLRPTSSTTIFLQQLGRGMRKKDNGLTLKVLDFVPTYKKVQYLTNGIQTLYLPSDILEIDFNNREQIPNGCEIFFEKIAIKKIKEMINISYFTNENINKIQNAIRNMKINIDEKNFESMLENYFNFFSKYNLTPFDIYHLKSRENGKEEKISFYSFTDIEQKNIATEKFRQVIFINAKNIIEYFINKLTSKISANHENEPFNRLLWFIIYSQDELNKIPEYYKLTYSELIIHKMEKNKAFINELLLLLNWKLKKEQLLDDYFLYQCEDETIKIPIGLNLTSFQIQHLIHYAKDTDMTKRINKSATGVFFIKNSDLKIVTISSSDKKNKYQYENAYHKDENIFNWSSDPETYTNTNNKFNSIKNNNIYIWYRLIKSDYKYQQYFQKYKMTNLVQFLGEGEYVADKPSKNAEDKSVIFFDFKVKQR